MVILYRPMIYINESMVRIRNKKIVTFSIKMYRGEKILSLQRMILFKCFSFYTYIRVCKFLNETKKVESF